LKKIKHLRKICIFLIFISLLGFSTNLNAQFYNGLRMNFGKNRVQYNSFYWNYYRYDKFDAYFYTDSKELSEYLSEFVIKKIRDVESFFEYSLEKRIIFIVYEKHSAFLQSNIANPEETSGNIGGEARILDNKVFVYYEGDRKKFEEQITHALTQFLFTEILYGGSLRDRVTSSAFLDLPAWFTEGLYSYVSRPWSAELENRIKDGIVSGKFDKMNRLMNEDAVIAGHSLWKYLVDNYGKNFIPNIIYLSKINRSYESGFMYAMGIDFSDFLTEWKNYYLEKFKILEKNTNPPMNRPLEIKFKKDRVYQKVKISPLGEKLVYQTNQRGKVKVFLYDITTHKQNLIYVQGNKLDQITDYTQPTTFWHPTGDMIAILGEEKGGITLTNYFVKTDKTVKRTLFKGGEDNRRIMFFDKIMEADYADDGVKMVFSATKFGKTDLYLYNITSNKVEQITNDLADDINPKFINQGTKIVFCSNRKSDTLKNDINNVKYDFDIFIYDLRSRSKVMKRITNTPYINETYPHYLQEDVYTYMNDETGIVNRYIARYDSAIAFIDTTTHYRYFINKQILTNYNRNILEQDVKQNKLITSEIVYANGGYKIMIDRENLIQKPAIQDSLVINSLFHKFWIAKMKKSDSLQAIVKPKKKNLFENNFNKINKQTDSIKYIPPVDTLYDIFNFVFEIEKQKQKQNRIERKDSLQSIANPDTFIIPPKNIYHTAFYMDQLAVRADFSFLNATYQPFYPGYPVYFNTGGMLMTKVGVKDLMENYKLSGAIGLTGINTLEYLLNYEDLSKRLDKKYVYHRQTLPNSNGDNEDTTFNIHSNQFYYILRYPLSQVNAFVLSSSVRQEKTVFHAKDQSSLITKNRFKHWGVLKGEYIFDNSKILGINLYEGTKFKLFAEYYRRLDKNKTNMYIAGVDFRHAVRLHRTITLYTRIGASTSWGQNKLIYYLGGVDNWMKFTDYPPQFDQNTKVSNNQNYTFQTVATNMRGFSQNVRNGTSFVVSNTELRMPIFKYLFNRPLNSDFFNNFQVIGFFDVGTAWAGKSPKSVENAYNTQIAQQGPITVLIDNRHAPVVAGYGWGMRSRLLGYFIRLDWAWGIEDNVILPRMFYLSLDLDF